MELDDTVCYCHHVSLRKLLNFARRERPRHAAKLAECLGAGTGCGWCVSILREIAAAADNLDDFRLDLTADAHAAGRDVYRRQAAPPGANDTGGGPAGRD